MLRLTHLILLIPSFSNVFAATVIRDLHIVNRQLAPDGFARDTVLADGVFPGPIIKGNKGDTFKINVIDELTDTTGLDTATSIHWHGIDQHKTNAEDGVSFVTQCPITPGNAFEYNFPVPNQAGTFWYHSHFENQYCDGLRGVFVIYDLKDPNRHLYDVDDENTVITLGDWYHYLSHNGPAISAFNSTLINGVGRFPGGPNSSSLAIVNVEKGKRYRFRVVAMSCDPNFTFSIDGHKLTIIEADGNNVVPHTVDQFTIYAAQRYSVVLNANQPVGNYWIRALPESGTIDGGLNAAILRYAGGPLADPTSTALAKPLILVESDLHALGAPSVPGKPHPGGADINIELDVTVDLVKGAFLMNNVTYASPEVPVLLQMLSGATEAQDLMPKGSIYPLELGKSVEVTIPGGILGGPHPVHLHGHSFHVVRSAGNTSYNFENPVVRDVVSIGNSTDDRVTIRFETDNPGPWMFHCHIDWHLSAGFAVVFAEAADKVNSTDTIPKTWQELCPSYTKFLAASNVTASTH
ncbi:laccase [Gloeopeniophorella convolvens]|nr:laccase [Gloeopeniophorella convolvens]